VLITHSTIKHKSQKCTSTAIKQHNHDDYTSKSRMQSLMSHLTSNSPFGDEVFQAISLALQTHNIKHPSKYKPWQNTKPQPVTRPHPFFIHYRTLEGRGVVPFIPALQCQQHHDTNININIQLLPLVRLFNWIFFMVKKVHVWIAKSRSKKALETGGARF